VAFEPTPIKDRSRIQTGLGTLRLFSGGLRWIPTFCGQHRTSRISLKLLCIEPRRRSATGPKADTGWDSFH